MELNEFLNLIRKRKQTVLFVTFLFLLIILAITVVQPLKYRATTRLLLVQRNIYNSDAYTISRSNQYLSNILSEVVYSDSFFKNVIDSGYNIRKDIFSFNYNKRMKQWRKMVSTKVSGDTGIIIIFTYHQDKDQASQINQAIAYTLKTKHSLYHGFGNNISVKIIDKSTVSNWPVKPNIILNTIFGILTGLSLSFCFIYLYPNKDVKIWQKKQKLSNFRDGYQSRYLENGNISGKLKYNSIGTDNLINKEKEELNLKNDLQDNNSFKQINDGEDYIIEDDDYYPKGDIKNLL